MRGHRIPLRDIWIRRDPILLVMDEQSDVPRAARPPAPRHDESELERPSLWSNVRTMVLTPLVAVGTVVIPLWIYDWHPHGWGEKGFIVFAFLDASMLVVGSIVWNIKHRNRPQ
jgi:hypothetical protein